MPDMGEPDMGDSTGTGATTGTGSTPKQVIRREVEEKLLFQCPKCAYEWAPHVEQPKQCPRCQKRLRYPVAGPEKE